MPAVTFDTLKFVETLKESGFDEKQAKGVAMAFREAQSIQVEELAAKRDLKALEGQVATKADVARVEMQIKMDVARLELQIQEVKRDMKEMELRIAAEIAPLKWGIAAAVGGIIALILKTFFPH